MSTEDHPDWWRPVGGSNAQDSTLERRSLIWNDNGIEDGTAPAISVECESGHGKFFTRGCRGMIEQILIYCQGDGEDEMVLRYSPHPCIGPIGEITFVPVVGWAWQGDIVEEMWNYDSLFIWVHACGENCAWALDPRRPLDGHQTIDDGATWTDTLFRPFIRAVYTGETPGDVPVSGVINTIPIPYSSSAVVEALVNIPVNVETTVVDLHGAGYCDYIEADVFSGDGSDNTTILVYCDEAPAGDWMYAILNLRGHTTSTPTISLSDYFENGLCRMLIHKRFEFRRRLRIAAWNIGNISLVTIRVHPTLMR